MRIFQSVMWRQFAAVTLLGLFAVPASAGVVGLNISDTFSYDGLGDSDNAVLVVDLNALLGTVGAVHVDGFGYDLLLDTVGASWLSEAHVSMQDSAGNLLVDLAPGILDTFAGTSGYDSGGIVDLVGLGLDFMLADGILVLEFYETFDDFENDIDAVWSGDIAISATGNPIPVPAAVWFLLSGVGALFGLRRRLN